MKFFNRGEGKHLNKRERALQLGDEVKQAAVTGQWKDVIKYQKELAQLLEDIGDVQGECECYATAASAYIAMEDFPNAIQAYEKALESVKELELRGIRRPEIEAICYNGLAGLYSNLGDSNKAREFSERSTRILEGLDDERLKQILGNR